MDYAATHPDRVYPDHPPKFTGHHFRGYMVAFDFRLVTDLVFNSTNPLLSQQTGKIFLLLLGPPR
jgi:hypothetical protein